MTPIKDLKLTPHTMFRYAIPKSRQIVNASTFKRLSALLKENNSNVLSESDKFYILYSKSDSFKNDALVEISFEAFIQEKAEEIAKRLNGGRFCHCYYSESLIYEMDRMYEVEVLGKPLWVALHQNKVAKNVSYNFNYITKK